MVSHSFGSVFDPYGIVLALISKPSLIFLKDGNLMKVLSDHIHCFSEDDPTHTVKSIFSFKTTCFH